MSYLFNRLSFDVPFDNAMYVDETAVRRLIDPDITPEAGFVNWMLGKSSASLTSLSGGHVMMPTPGALPTYKNSSLVLPAVATGFNGLSTEYNDSNSMTLTAVIQYSGAASQILLGVNTGTQGECIYMSGTSVMTHLVRNALGASVTTVIPVPAGLTAGKYIFLAFSRNGDNLVSMVGGASTQVNLTDSVKTPATAAKVGPGNTAYNTNGFSKQLEVVECLYRDGPTTLADLQTSYANAKTRCALRGISLI
ncbi:MULTISPECIES: hypothetical protein [Klebsiella]|uniref:hypothetical protein n=1 Tax=Klebsiella TaxID=570 RepID=UPI00287C81C7|nr:MULTISPECIES: hypothetical protein [Klebsiella]ELR9566994.1 hypothetical protein [Klebsiella michiganensis]MDS7880200.1 hypothetical protein [Klebsiella pasteurii]MDT8626678.1 hypothetical protein [Klebsiella grimontii]